MDLSSESIFLSLSLTHTHTIYQCFFLLCRPNLKYDVGVYKVCGTCAEATAYKNEMDLSFCDPMTYGYDADLSGLAMVPLSASGTPLDGNLRGVLDYHTTVANVNDAPSVQWPSSLKNELDQGAGPALVADILNGLDSLCAASTGAVSMLPDGIGYGETQATHNRSFIVAKYYQQEGYVLWRKTQQWLSTLTNGCTQLQDIASVTGSSEGGLSSIVGADMLHNLGVRILKVYSNAGPINADSVLQFGIESYDQGLISLTKSNIFYQFIVPFSAYSFDNDRLDLPNYGSNQTTISDAYSVQVDQWMSSPDPIPGVQVIGLMPQYGPSILSPDLLNMFQSASAANTYDPCTSQYNIPGETDLICEGILKSDYLDKVNAAVSRSRLFSLELLFLRPVSSNIIFIRCILQTYPIEICAGKNDTVIPYDVQFTPEYITGSQVNVLQNLIGAPIQGDHAAVVFQCSINFVNSFAGLAIPTEEDEKPFLITPTAPGVCQTQPPTQAPTLSNVGSTANTTTTTTGPTTSSAWSFLRTDKAAAAMLWLSIIIPFVAVV